MNRIVLTERDPIMGTVLTSVLERRGYAVELTRRGMHVLEVLHDAQRAPAPRGVIVMCDAHLIDCGGLQLLERIRDRHPHTPVVFMAPAGREVMCQRARRLGAIVLRRPFDVTALIEALHIAISGARNCNR